MKIVGSYASLEQGVSQQPPEVRTAGQHTEQVNMLPDPVKGLTRRRGSILQSISIVPVDGTPPYTADFVESTGDGYRKIEHTAGGVNYVILLREYTDKGGVFVGDCMPPILCYNRDNKAFIGVQWNAADFMGQTTVAALGVSAAVSVGQYLMFALKNNACSITTTSMWSAATNLQGSVTIRGGAYSRTYTIMVGGFVFSYISPPSTTTLPNPESYIQPAYIAQQLAASMTATLANVVCVGSSLSFTLPAGTDVGVSDGGDGSLMRGVGLMVDDVTKLPTWGFAGHIVKIQPSPSSWFYVQAVARNSNGGTGLSEVIWRECAGEQQGTSLTGLGVGKIINGTLYVGITQPTNVNGIGHAPSDGTTPVTLVPSFAGDSKLNTPHRWMSHSINYMGLFQDRLLIGSGAALSVSAAGDYLNFFRSTMTTIPSDDGFEVVAQGGEDDVLRHSVTYNRNLVIFGDKRQYLIPGSTPFIPTSPNMSIMTVYANAAQCKPVAAGGQIYYALNREGWAGIHQIQPGQYVDSAESFPASAHVSTYIPAPAVEIEAIPGTPAMLAVRSRASPRTIYVFSYVDLPDGRKQDAWFRLEFNRWCGYLMAMYSTPDGLLLFWARKDGVFNSVWRAVDLLPITAADNGMPYLDSMRTRLSMNVNSGEIAQGHAVAVSDWSEAFDNSAKSGGRYMLGAPFDNNLALALEALPEAGGPIDPLTNLWVGMNFDSYVIPTNPMFRDPAGRVMTTGRTTITKLVVNTKASGGMDWEVTDSGATRTGTFTGRIMGNLLNAIGTVPIVSSLVSVPIGRETRAYSLKLKARQWLPLSIAGIEWTGQSFNRTPSAR